ncbi:MCE family protein [Amycolatopsis anabasis]|uniref:MCE family protein n=1 Tax=Amycolatopsis anabasis TaxID=1840409 RepID=UPI00131D47EF|nr:MCE family protein [Amycolatopsis anabasis]
MTGDERYRSPRLRVLGLVYLVLVAVFLWFTVALYRDVFATEVTVMLRTDRAGSQLQRDADVKLRGVNVGRVREVRSAGGGAELDLALDPAQVDRIPRNVSARLLPKTLFGERYVNLVAPAARGTGHLEAGDVIGQDRSAASIELERVLDNLLPLLRSVQPQKLASMLTSVSQAFEGRGKSLGETLVLVGQYVGELNPQLPEITSGLTSFAKASDTYDDAADDFLRALTDFSVTSGTIAQQRESLETLYRTLTVATEDVTSFLARNKENLISLSESSRPTLELLARYAPEYACLLRAVAEFKPRVDIAFGKGSGRPGARAQVKVVPDRGKYLPGVDDPRYDSKTGPRCYGPGAIPPQAATPTIALGGDLANSPREREFLAGLLGPAIGLAPGEVPAWSGLLVGPLYRGAEVTVE